VKQIPLGLPTLLKTWQLDSTIQSAICCPFCCALHPLPSQAGHNVQPLLRCNYP
jgi:hypothetical protein